MEYRPRRRNPSSWLQIPLIFTFYIFLQVVQVAYAQPTNITVEDDDPSIRYSPPAAWGWSWDELPTILSSFDGGGNKVARIMKRDPQYPSVEYDRIGGGTGTSSDPGMCYFTRQVPSTDRCDVVTSRTLPQIHIRPLIRIFRHQYLELSVGEHYPLKHGSEPVVKTTNPDPNYPKKCIQLPFNSTSPAQQSTCLHTHGHLHFPSSSTESPKSYPHLVSPHSRAILRALLLMMPVPHTEAVSSTPIERWAKAVIPSHSPSLYSQGGT